VVASRGNLMLVHYNNLLFMSSTVKSSKIHNHARSLRTYRLLCCPPYCVMCLYGTVWASVRVCAASFTLQQ